MINFTVGPVQSPDIVRQIGSQDCPYFRTAEFSAKMLESERMIKELAGAPAGSRVVFLTASGTGGMESAVVNVLTPSDRVLVINGGSFGGRFCRLCEIYNIPYDEIKLAVGTQITADRLSAFEGRGYAARLVNKHETSTGVHYDMRLLSEFCKRNKVMLIVDNISSFLADEFDMERLGADVMIAGSQKALACPPGVSMLVLAPRALERLSKIRPRSMYFDLQDALANQMRGQTPFTPAVGTLLQIHARLCQIMEVGGAASEISRCASLAEYFRSKIIGLPLEIVSESMSNAVTPLHPTNGMSAYDVFLRLKDEYGIWICPNGGDLKDEVFRVGHIGALTTKDVDALVLALKEVLG